MRIVLSRTAALLRTPSGRGGALAFGIVGIAFFVLTVGQADASGHLFHRGPLWVEWVQAALLWCAWTVWGAVTTAQWAARRRGRFWLGAGASAGAAGVAVPTAVVCATACGVAGGAGVLGSLLTVGTVMAVSAWMPWVWSLVAVVLVGLTARQVLPPRVNMKEDAVMAQATQRPGWNWATKEVMVLGTALALLIGVGSGYVLGGAGHVAAATGGRVAPSTGGSTAPSGGRGTTGGASPTPTAWTVGQGVPRGTLDTLTGQSTTLARGSKGTVIVEMATWCLFCGYTDKYDVPQWAKTPGWTVDVVDINTDGGIANPGPISPPFSGHDNVGNAISRSGREQTLSQYAQTYGIRGDAHFYVASAATISAWNVQSYPTLITLNGSGTVTSVTPGAVPATQARSWLTQHASA